MVQAGGHSARGGVDVDPDPTTLLLMPPAYHPHHISWVHLHLMVPIVSGQASYVALRIIGHHQFYLKRGQNCTMEDEQNIFSFIKNGVSRCDLIVCTFLILI